MSKIKFMVFAIVAVMAFGTTAMSQTVTVSQSGGADYTSIQAAIDSIAPTNGVADVIQILDSATYAEQIEVGGPHEVPEVSGDANGGTITDLINSNRDPITLIGMANSPAVIAPQPGTLASHSVFEDDAEGDNYQATLSYVGSRMTFVNLNIQQIGGEPYGVNGQGVDIEFRDCLFTGKPGTGAPGESRVNFNNSDRIAHLYNDVGNEVLFDGCVFDGELEDGTKAEASLYFHGINNSDLLFCNDTFVFDGCTFTNMADDLTALRARNAEEGDVHQSMINCLFIDNDGPLSFNGGGNKVADGCKFVNNANGPEVNSTNDTGALVINGRSGRTGDIKITDCIFSNNASYEASQDVAGDRWAAVLVQNDGDDGPVVIDHCTFDGNGAGVRFFDPSFRVRTVNITDSIFSNNVTAGMTADGTDGSTYSYIESDGAANLDLTVANCLFHNNGQDYDLGVVSGSVSGDPMYADMDMFSLQAASPAAGAASDGTNIGAWQEVSNVEHYSVY